jgi:small conductance mechanosensitive channel
VLSVVTTNRQGPSYLGLNSDPEYPYLLNALNVATLRVPGLWEHPGTTLQGVGALVILGKWAAGCLFGPWESLQESVLRHPEAYLHAMGLVLNLLLAGAIYVVARRIYQLSESLLAALVFQVSFGLFTATVRAQSRPTPELMLAIAVVILALPLAPLVVGRDTSLAESEERWLAMATGAALAFGIVTKITFAPLVAVCLLFRTGRARLVCLVSCVVGVLVLLFPIWTHFSKMPVWFSSLLIRKVETAIRNESRTAATAREKRAATIGAVLRGATRTVILMIGALMAARVAGLDITPALAAAGGFGVAVGLGAQTIIRDCIAGFFIIHENQFDVGDVVRAAGVSGTVEMLSLRHTELRDSEGFIHFVPNGEIKVVTNLTKSWSTPMVRIPISAFEDPDRVIEIVERVISSFQADPTIRPIVLDGPKLLGIEDVAAGYYTLLLQAKTVPEHRLVVARALRRKLLQALRAEGVALALGANPDGSAAAPAVAPDPTALLPAATSPPAASSASDPFGESR